MKALQFDQGLSLIDVDDPRPGPGEALIRIRIGGICQTDVEITKGYMGFRGILGHEFVGEVVECENAGWVGKRVVAEINVGCGSCEACRTGKGRHCPERSVLGILNRNGAFAEFLTLPVTNLHTVQDSISDEEAVFVEPLAAACEILEQVHIEPDHRVLVVGDGKLAQLVVRVLRLTGCPLSVVGMHSSKLNLLNALGVQTVLECLPEDDDYDIVVDASGSASGFHAALEHVKSRGILVLKSTTHQEIRFNPAKIVVDEIRVVGSRCGPFEPALRLLEQGLIEVESLIWKTFPFELALNAMDAAMEPAALKVLLDFRN